jgi:hypothetical protein
MELVYMTVLETVAARHVGSTPTKGTKFFGRSKTIMAKTTKLHELNKAELIFVDEYMEHGDHIRAHKAAGYAQVRGNASKKLKELRLHLQSEVYVKIGTHVPWAVGQLVELARNAASETVRLNALKDILSRAGYDQAIQIETSDVSEKDLDSKEMNKEIQDLIQLAGPQLKIVGK